MNPKIYTVFLLLLGLTLPVLSDKCPDRDRLPTTCKCQDEFADNEFMDAEVDVRLSCSHSAVWELKDALRLMDKSSRLEVQVYDVKLGYLPSRIFYGLNVTTLDISFCELDGLAPPGETALEELKETLEVLIINHSFTEDERPTTLYSLSHLSRLGKLYFFNNAITEVHNHWFSSPPPALFDLIFIDNSINKLGDRAFEKLVNLEYLVLNGNRFGPIKRSMLPTPANRLEDLQLIDNDFTSVPDDLFTDMPALKSISINENRIAHLQERAFKPIWSQLDEFDARDNPIECNSTMEWLFHVRTNVTVYGTCTVKLVDFIGKKEKMNLTLY